MDRRTRTPVVANAATVQQQCTDVQLGIFAVVLAVVLVLTVHVLWVLVFNLAPGVSSTVNVPLLLVACCVPFGDYVAGILIIWDVQQQGGSSLTNGQPDNAHGRGALNRASKARASAIFLTKVARGLFLPSHVHLRVALVMVGLYGLQVAIKAEGTKGVGGRVDYTFPPPLIPSASAVIAWATLLAATIVVITIARDYWEGAPGSEVRSSKQRQRLQQPTVTALSKAKGLLGMVQNALYWVFNSLGLLSLMGAICTHVCGTGPHQRAMYLVYAPLAWAGIVTTRRLCVLSASTGRTVAPSSQYEGVGLLDMLRCHKYHLFFLAAFRFSGFYHSGKDRLLLGLYGHRATSPPFKVILKRERWWVAAAATIEYLPAHDILLFACVVYIVERLHRAIYSYCEQRARREAMRVAYAKKARRYVASSWGTRKGDGGYVSLVSSLVRAIGSVLKDWVTVVGMGAVAGLYHRTQSVPMTLTILILTLPPALAVGGLAGFCASRYRGYAVEKILVRRFLFSGAASTVILIGWECATSTHDWLRPTAGCEPDDALAVGSTLVLFLCQLFLGYRHVVGTFHECPICALDVRGVDCTNFSPLCQHTATWCHSCVTQTLGAMMIQDGAANTHITCCYDGCSSAVSYNNLSSLADPDTFEAYDKLLAKQAIEREEGFRYCLNPACTGGAVYNPAAAYDDPIIQCELCGAHSCYKHNVPCVGGVIGSSVMQCSQCRGDEMAHENALSEKHIAEKTRACPRCKVRIEKNDGCDHMTCRSCKHEFCWECFAPYNRRNPTDLSGHAPTCRHYNA